MRVFLNFRQNSPNDEEGQEEKDGGVRVVSVTEASESAPVEAEPELTTKRGTVGESSSTTRANSKSSSFVNKKNKEGEATALKNSALSLRGETITSILPAPSTPHSCCFPPKKCDLYRDSLPAKPSRKRTPAAAKKGRFKTTGLDKCDAPASSLPPSNRKRKAFGQLEEQSKFKPTVALRTSAPSCHLDKKPKARVEFKTKEEPGSNSVAVSTANRFTMVSGNSHERRINTNIDGGNDSSNRPWRYYDVRQFEDDIRQDPEDPVEELSENFPAENNPESARGDPIATRSSFSNHSVGFNATIEPDMPRFRELDTENPAVEPRNASCTTTAASLDGPGDFVAALKQRGLEIREQEGDGNCLFRAISLQVYGDASMHAEIRKSCMDFMERDQEHFSQFVTGEPFAEYIARKRLDGVHGNNPEIQAISELFNRPIEVFTPDTGAKPLNIFHAEYKTDDAPIRLSYHDGNHYNAVIDPLVPTAGLGLGLPGLQPGLADKLQMAKAVAESDAAADKMEFQRAMKESEEDELQRKMKESEEDELQRAIKLSRMSADAIFNDRATMLSDLDATYEQLEQAALEESLRHVGHGDKKRASTLSSEEETRDDSIAASFETIRSLSNAEYAVGSMAAAAASMPAESAFPSPSSTSHLRPVEEYSNTVQELVMNGFDLRDVLKAYDLVGDSFDDILSLLLANSS